MSRIIARPAGLLLVLVIKRIFSAKKLLTIRKFMEDSTRILTIIFRCYERPFFKDFRKVSFI